MCAMAMTARRQPGAALQPAEVVAWRGLLRVHTAIVKALDAELERAHGLPLISFEVLVQLTEARGERMRMCDLASTVLLSRSGLTRLVDRLEAEGLLERVACSTDARGAYARLTPSGRERVRGAQATHAAALRALFLRHFGEDELEQLGRFWERVLPAGRGCC
jgi:DNA-binding MarR family transcriptional regulator